MYLPAEHALIAATDGHYQNAAGDWHEVACLRSHKKCLGSQCVVLWKRCLLSVVFSGKRDGGRAKERGIGAS